LRTSIDGSSPATADTNGEAPIRSPAAANEVGASVLTVSIRVATLATPGTPVVVSAWRRPWKSLMASSWIWTGAADAGDAVTSGERMAEQTRRRAASAIRPGRGIERTSGDEGGCRTPNLRRPGFGLPPSA